MKRIISGIMAVCLTVSGYAIPAEAETNTYGNLTYDFTGAGTIEITGCDKSAESIVIPEEIDGKKVTGIGSYAFANCEGIGNIEIPPTVTSISIGAFSGCKGLTEVRLPESLSEIERSIFAGCRSLKEVSIPENVVNIGGSVFLGCTALEKITIPDSVEKIQLNAFDGCTSLETFEVSADNAYYSSIDSVLFNKDGTEIIKYFTGLPYEIYEIPSGVEKIGSYAFKGCNRLEEVKIPESVESIGAGAFSDCGSIMKMKIPESVVNIGENEFRNCKSLLTVNIPENMEEIKSNVFFNCFSLQAIEFPEGLKTIGAGAFNHCQTLKNLDFPEGLERIGYEAFMECTGLTEITIPKNVKLIDNYAFYRCGLSKATILSEDCELRPTSVDNMNATQEMKMYGCKDSTAQEYARQYGHSFYTLNKFTGGMFGDIDDNKRTEEKDVTLLKKFLLEGVDTGIKNWQNADINGDGVIDIFDLCLVNGEVFKWYGG